MPSAELGRKREGHFRVVIFGSRLEQGLNADFGSCCAAALWDVMPAKRRTAAKRRQGVAQPTHVGSRVRGSGNEMLPLRPAQLRDYREMPDWPFADTLAEDRLAPSISCAFTAGAVLRSITRTRGCVRMACSRTAKRASCDTFLELSTRC